MLHGRNLDIVHLIRCNYCHLRAAVLWALSQWNLISNTLLSRIRDKSYRKILLSLSFLSRQLIKNNYTYSFNKLISLPIILYICCKNEQRGTTPWSWSWWWWHLYSSLTFLRINTTDSRKHLSLFGLMYAKHVHNNIAWCITDKVLKWIAICRFLLRFLNAITYNYWRAVQSWAICMQIFCGAGNERNQNM